MNWVYVAPENSYIAKEYFASCSFSPAQLTVLRTSIYGQARSGGTWFELYLDDNDILRSDPLSGDEINAYTAGNNEYTHLAAGLDLYIGHRIFPLFVDITSPEDQGQYFYNVVIDKQGVTCLLGDR